MSVITEAIGRIALKQLNGQGLDAAQNGPPIAAAIGVGDVPADLDSAESLGDEEFTEISRECVETRIYSTENPDVWVAVKDATKLELLSKDGRRMIVTLSEPVQEG